MTTMAIKRVQIPSALTFPVTVRDVHIDADEYVIKGGALYTIEDATGRSGVMKAPQAGMVLEGPVEVGAVFDSPVPVIGLGDSAAGDARMREKAREAQAEPPPAPPVEPTAPAGPKPVETKPPKASQNPNRKRRKRNRATPRATGPAGRLLDGVVSGLLGIVFFLLKYGVWGAISVAVLVGVIGALGIDTRPFFEGLEGAYSALTDTLSDIAFLPGGAEVEHGELRLRDLERLSNGVTPQTTPAERAAFETYLQTGI